MRIRDWRSDVCSSDLPVGLTLRTNRYGKVLSAGGSNDLAVGPGDGPADYTLGAKWITDIEGRITLVDGLQIAVGADNVFDVYPDHVPVGGAFGTAGYYLPYSSFSPFGFNGRFLYGRLRSEEHTSELQSLMRISYAVFCLKKRIYTSTLVVLII